MDNLEWTQWDGYQTAHPSQHIQLTVVSFPTSKGSHWITQAGDRDHPLAAYVGMEGVGDSIEEAKAAALAAVPRVQAAWDALTK